MLPFLIKEMYGQRNYTDPIHPLNLLRLDKDNFNVWGTYFFSIDWKNQL